MAKYIPIINCGYNAGSSPLCWLAEGIASFETEEECSEWIEEHLEDFSLEEMGGGVYPHKFD